MLMRLIGALCFATLGLALAVGAGRSVEALQPTVRASEAWINASETGGTETTAFVAVDNGTMYDVYIVGAATEVATIELRDRPKGAPLPAAIKEVPVPAFGRLEMSPDGVHLHLSQLKQPLVSGEMVRLVLYTDGGEQFAVAATVK